MSGVLDRDEMDVTDPGPPILTVVFSSSGSRCVLTMEGELVGTSVAALEAQIDRLAGSACDKVVLDVTGLRLIDAIGVRVILGLDTYVRALGAQLYIVGGKSQVVDTLTPTPLDVRQVAGQVPP